MIIPYRIELATGETVNIGAVVGRSRIPVACGGQSVVGQAIALEIEANTIAINLEVAHPIIF